MITIITIFDTGNGIAVISRLSNQAIGSLVIILHFDFDSQATSYICMMYLKPWCRYTKLYIAYYRRQNRTSMFITSQFSDNVLRFYGVHKVRLSYIEFILPIGYNLKKGTISRLFLSHKKTSMFPLPQK